MYHKGLKENAFLALGTVANKCGRIAGENIMGKHIKFTGALGSAAIKVCDLEMGRTGLGEAEAQRQAIDYRTVIVEAMDHPAYYLRYCKTFSRMGGEMRYLSADNRDFLLALWGRLGARGIDHRH